MDAPSFIFDMFEKELVKLQEDLLIKVATKYNLDKDELVNTFLKKEITLKPNNSISIVVTRKKIANKTEIKSEERCQARIWNRGQGGQCTRKKCDKNDFCSQHVIKQKHGIITEPVDPKVFPKKSTAIYK